ncbi:thioredoxin family protein [Streptomyces sp. NPDC050528]|uniref:thioredoxin family protein n=1 Tax=Streptomyces sp. NPDC050528 TaxID=3365623 RepID=UPI003792F528
MTPIADQAELDAALAVNPRVVVMFEASWCGPCKQIAPKYAQFAAAYGAIQFLSVDVDVAEDVALKYDISSMPNFVTIRDGKEMDRFSGANPERLEEKLKAMA